MVTKEQGGIEQVAKDFEKERGGEIDIMASKTGEQWMDLYNGLAGKKVFRGRKDFSDAPLSYEKFKEMIFGPEEERWAMHDVEMVLFSKVDLLVKELGGQNVDKEKKMQKMFEGKVKEKPEINVLKLKSGEEWKKFYNALAGKRFLRKLNYYDDEEAAGGEALSITDFLEIVDQTIPSKKYQDRELVAKINEFLKKLAPQI